MEKVDIFGVDYAVTDYVEATKLIIDKAMESCSFSVFALPVSGVIAEKHDATFKDAVGSADMIVPDGQPIKWAMNFFYDVGLKDRVYGPVLAQHILKGANDKKLRIFLYGGATEEVLNDFNDYIERTFPEVVICGKYREEYFGAETLNLELLRNCSPHIVLVGLGCPTQEKWIEKNKGCVDAVMVGVGAAFSFHSGHVKMAPKWLQNMGLEWFYRLCKEPKRLWKRYLSTNTYFIILVMRKFFVSLLSWRS